MANPLKLEYMNLIPWKRGPKDEELGLDDDNISDSGSHYHHPIGIRPSCGSSYSLNEGDLGFLGLIREESPLDVADDAMRGVNGSMAGIAQRMVRAIEEKDPKKLEFLLRNGADPNAQFGVINKTSPLHLATTQGTPELVRLLIQHGANVRQMDSRGVTVLHMAAAAGELELIHLFIEHGADVNVQDHLRESGGGLETPLHRAAMAGSTESVQLLLKSGANVNAGDSRGRTALHCAAQRGAVGVLQVLLNHSADPNIQDKRGTTALLLLGGSFLMRGHRRAIGYTESLDILIKNNAEVNVHDPDTGITPLHQAVTLGRIESVKTLLLAGAILNAEDREGVIPLHACSLRGHAAILKLILAHPSGLKGLNLSDSKGRTALHKAAYRGSVECIQLLLKAGADLGLKTKSGLSAATLILRLPTGAKILGERFDESITTNSVDPNENACRMKFDYSILLSTHKIQQMGVVEDILDDPRERRTEDLLEHPLIDSFLFLKWRKIRLLFFSNVIFYLILVAGVTSYVLFVTSSEATRENPATINGTSTNGTTASPATSEPERVYNLQQLLSVIILIIIFQEVVQLASLHIQYFREAESWIKLGALITSTIVIFTPRPQEGAYWEKWVHHVAAFAVLFGWTELTLLLGRLPTFGVYALMFYSVAQHLVKFIFVFFFFLAGFAFSFHIMFKNMIIDDKKTAFESPWSSILRTLSMMIGDVNYDEYMLDEKTLTTFEGTAHVIYFCFLILVALILMNLLIGLAVNDIQGLQKEGRVKRLRKQAQFIVYLEDIASNRFLKLILREKITKSFNEWINQSPTFTINPSSTNRKSKTVRLPSSLVERALAIAQEDRLPVDRITNRDTYNLVHDCITSIESLRQRIENLEQGLIGSSSSPSPEEAHDSHRPSIDVTPDDIEEEHQEIMQEEMDHSSSDTDDVTKRLISSDQVDGGPMNYDVRYRGRRGGAYRSLKSELNEIKQMLSLLTTTKSTPSD